MQDNFYDRLDYYRMLNAGVNNLAEMAVALQVPGDRVGARPTPVRF